MGKGIECLTLKQVKREKKATVKWKLAIRGQSAIDLAQGARGDVFSIGCMQPHQTPSGSRYIVKHFSLQQPSVPENGTCNCNRSMRRSTLLLWMHFFYLYAPNMPTPICALSDWRAAYRVDTINWQNDLKSETLRHQENGTQRGCQSISIKGKWLLARRQCNWWSERAARCASACRYCADCDDLPNHGQVAPYDAME